MITTEFRSLLAQAGFLERVGPYVPTLLMLLGIGVVCYLLLRMNSNILRRRSNSNPVDDVRELRGLLGERSRDSEFADVPVEVLRWQVEMHNTARDLKAEIDSKILILQALLVEVRAERQKLEQALEETRQGRKQV